MSARPAHVQSASHSSYPVTVRAAAFVAAARPDRFPAALFEMASRCIADTTGLYIAGLLEPSTRIVIQMAAEDGGRGDALLLGCGETRTPAHVAARALGIAAHAHDFDDTQVSRDPAHVYGLLTHPSAAPLSAAIAMADTLGDVSAADFLTAFCVGFEVSCKISEWLKPDHYLRGHHSSGTVATFGAAAATSYLLRLDQERVVSALGIAASMAAGIRCNFGTMTKPWHVGRAAENGVLAARMAARGFTADTQALDGRWGFASVLAGGFSPEKPSQGFGRTWSMLEPGVSIKPYPSGILTHQSMDMVRKLIIERDIRPETIERIDFYAGDNILNPIRYGAARNALEAKFSMCALLSMLALYRNAGLNEFDDHIIASPSFQAMQHKVHVHRDEHINSLGFDIIRSRVEISDASGKRYMADADPRYRGGPDFPMSRADIEEKFRNCAAKAPAELADSLLASIWGLPKSKSISLFLDLLRQAPMSAR